MGTGDTDDHDHDLVPDVDALADRLFAAIGAGDLEAFEACLAPDMTAWTNFDDRTQDRVAILGLIRWMSGAVEGLRYDVVRRQAIPGGFVQQHVLRGRGPGGVEIAMPACIVATVRDGRVARMEEYADPTPMVSAFRRG